METAVTNVKHTECDEGAGTWNPELLRAMDWKLFEDLCVEVLVAAGYEAESTGAGPDRCVDIRMKTPGAEEADVAVQCKRQKTPVAVKQVREFFGAITTQGYTNGLFITTGGFRKRVLDEFGENGGLRLVTGEQFLEGVADLGTTEAGKLFDFVVRDHADNWRTPTCPACNIKMVVRERKKGKNLGSKFWGCANFGAPQNCRKTFSAKQFPIPEEES